MPFTIKMFKEMFWLTNLTSQKFSVITFIIVSPISETVCGTTNILLKTYLTCRKIHRTSKCFHFRYIGTYLAPVTLHFQDPIVLSIGQNLANQIATQVSGGSSQYPRSQLKYFLNFIHVKQKMKVFSNDAINLLSNRLYVKTNSTPLFLLLD